MELTIAGYKLRLDMVILFVILFWIMAGHTLCSCSRVGMYEGFEIAKQATESMVDKAKGKSKDTSPASKVVPQHIVGKEGFASLSNMPGTADTLLGASHDENYVVNPANWSSPTLTYKNSLTADSAIKGIWAREKQPVPLPEGQLDMFATTSFKPECCPNAYSSSTGCACMTMDQYNALKTRWGNNVPYSEY